MILRLAQQLEVPLRERNVLLLSGGYTPAFPANQLADSLMQAVHEAIEHVLRAHEPYPAVVSTPAGSWWRPTTPCRC
jgi:hypothetical protein